MKSRDGDGFSGQNQRSRGYIYHFRSSYGSPEQLKYSKAKSGAPRGGTSGISRSGVKAPRHLPF